MRCATMLAVSLVFMAGATARAADDKAPSYTKDIQPFLTTYCVDCHGAGKPKAGVRVDSYEALFKAGKKTLVVAGKPADSHLLLTLDGKGKKMPPKKYASQPTAKEIAVVKAWIVAGAKDDTPKADALLIPSEGPLKPTGGNPWVEFATHGLPPVGLRYREERDA